MRRKRAVKKPLSTFLSKTSASHLQAYIFRNAAISIKIAAAVLVCKRHATLPGT